MINISIMAIPPREHWVNLLLGQLRDEGLDATVYWDHELTKNPWLLAKQCWESLFDTDAKWQLLLQDDAILCKDFRLALYAVLNARPNDIISFYTTRKTIKNSPKAWGAANATWGLGMVMTRADVAEFLEWEAKFINPQYKHDDSRLSIWCNLTKRLVYHTIPTLVEHREGKSSMGHYGKSRSGWFADDAPGSVLLRPWHDLSSMRIGGWPLSSYGVKWIPEEVPDA